MHLVDSKEIGWFSRQFKEAEKRVHVYLWVIFQISCFFISSLSPFSIFQMHPKKVAAFKLSNLGKSNGWDKKRYREIKEWGSDDSEVRLDIKAINSYIFRGSLTLGCVFLSSQSKGENMNSTMSTSVHEITTNQLLRHTLFLVLMYETFLP